MSKQHSIPNAEIANSYFYEAVRESLTSDELGVYVSYGISVSLNGQTVAFVSDVSPDGADVERLVERCNREQLDPIHLNDVIEDHLSEVTIS